MPICHYCAEQYKTWRAVLWHLVVDHEDALRATIDARFGHAVIDPEDADVASLTEVQSRELVAAFAGLAPGTDPAAEWRQRPSRRRVCPCCNELRIAYVRGICRRCWRQIRSAESLAESSAA